MYQGEEEVKMKMTRFAMAVVLMLAVQVTVGCGDDGDSTDATKDVVETPEDVAGGEKDVPIEADVPVEADVPTEEDVSIEKDEGGQEALESELLLAYLEGENGDYINASAPHVVGAADVMADGLENWVILDTRSQDKYGPDGNGDWQIAPNGTPDYEDGHIDGAVLVEWNAAHAYAADNLSKDDKILVVCHTGQLAGHAVLVLNLLGYDAWSMKWGMSAWHSDFDLWSLKTSSDFAGQFVKDAAPAKPEAGDYPELSTGKATGEEILAARLEAVLAEGPRFIEIPDFMAAPEDFFVVNYWPEAEYLEPGHLAGSYQYTPLASLHSAADLATLPTDQTIVVYCYSGQHGSQVALWLTLLGYDARDLKFGTNGLMYDDMIKKQWPGETGSADYDYVSAE
jgi:rhodanese-related sulfurtransferase